MFNRFHILPECVLRKETMPFHEKEPDTYNVTAVKATNASEGIHRVL